MGCDRTLGRWCSLSDSLPAHLFDGEVPRLHAERLDVKRHVHETGRVSVATITRTQQQALDELLTREHVEIEHVEIGCMIDEMPGIREEGDSLIIPVVEEVAIVVRRLRLTKEIRITRVRGVRHHQEVVELRRQEAVVRRSPADAASYAPTSQPKENTDAQ